MLAEVLEFKIWFFDYIKSEIPFLILQKRDKNNSKEDDNK